MFGRTKRGSTVSTLVLVLALVLTVFLPDLVAGKPDAADPAHVSAAGPAPRPELTPASFVDTTVVDFGAGTLDAGTYISETTDGEVILAPTFGTEFSGDTPPPGMTGAQWFPPNGTASLAGGKVTLDGVKVGTIALYGPGRTLEFSANFSGSPLNSSGFGTMLTAAPWAVFRTPLTVVNLMDSTNNGTTQNGNVPGSLFNAFHRYRIDWKTDIVAYYVDGTLVSTHTNPPTADMRPIFSDFLPGGGKEVFDWFRMSPYAASGMFVSRVFDAGSNARWIDLQATSELPDGTNIVLETRSGDTAAPDETWSPWTGLSGNAITSPNARYLQYRATLSSTDPSLTPALQSATITYLAPCAPETCNGIDDDCDGNVDNGTSLCDDHNPCTADSCVDGRCVFRPTAGVACDDDNPCTTGDACNADGRCAGTPTVCNDDNTCTADACENGVCVFKPVAGITCDDGNVCTDHDVCNTDGQCSGSPIACDDGNPCTTDACVNGVCASQPAPGAPCSDGNACTDHDVCNTDGQCSGTPILCDDGNACTADACENGVCVSVPTAGVDCSDGNACTDHDVCNTDGRCVGTGLTCDDHNPCTADTCRDGQCIFTATPGAACDDGDACTADDHCVESPLEGISCQGTPTNCDDNNSCTVDRCEPQGCVVPDNGEGTADLPPQGCGYASQSPLMILEGLPTGSAIELAAKHGGFTCPTASTLCSFVPPIPGVDCDQPGGTLGGEQECASATLGLNLTGTGSLAGFSRTLGMSVDSETQDGPRTLGDPVQSFPTLMFRLSGQITGDPDFDLLRITAGTDFGLPSPGQTTLTQAAGGQWVVDSFFDLTYRIDYIGAPGGTLAGMSGSTTGTVRFSTGGRQCVHTPVDCDDGSACTTDRCNPDTGKCEHLPVVCDDGDECTRDFCDPDSGTCKSESTPGVICDDANACTTGDVCNPDGRCAGTPVLCDDQNPCTEDACLDGECRFIPISGTTCDDGNACTQADMCENGLCVGGNPVQCTASDQCHDAGTCDPATGTCSNPAKPDGSACDDGDACTAIDTCQSGVCTGSGTASATRDHLLATGWQDSLCEGSIPSLCVNPTVDHLLSFALSDGRSYQFRVLMETDGSISSIIPTRPVIVEPTPTGASLELLDSGFVVYSTTAFALIESGATIYQDLDFTEWEPAYYRLTTEHGEVITFQAATGRVIDAGVLCEPCRNQPDGTSCDDGNACTQTDTCQGGTCVGDHPVTCAAPDQCHEAGVCDPHTGTCSNRPKEAGTPCDDGAACTTHDVCNSDGRCGGEAIICDDENPCTRDSCDATTGQCVHDPNPGALCDDGDACTQGDSCVQIPGNGVICRGTPTSCDDQNECTRDACDPTTGRCVHDLTPGTICDDGDACTRNDVCNSDGRCAGTPITCNDNNSCTSDACVDGQCVFTPTPETACDDGNACTRGDTCNADGRCIGPAVSCDDGNGCTDDSCNPSSGCVHVNNSASCDDGNVCTTGDVCRNGQCAGGSPSNCDDGNTCTADTCDPRSGCVHSPRAVLQTVCGINPATLNLNAQGNSFTINLSVVDACNPTSPSPIPPGTLGIAHVSRAGNTHFPDPASLSCPDPDGGTRFETGLFEDLAARSISGNTVSLKFDRPSDGVCSTLDGNRQDLIAAMTDVLDGSSANVCVSSTVGSQVFQCCTSVRVLNHGNRQ